MAGHQSEPRQFLRVRAVGDAAVGADPPQQSLGDDPDQGGADHERFHPHLIQTGDSAGGVVAMQGGQHQVTGQGCLNGCFRCFQIAGFSHQQHVRVLTHEGPQGLTEIEPFVAVHLALGDPGQGVFDRIFNRGDVDSWLVAFRQ